MISEVSYTPPKAKPFSATSISALTVSNVNYSNSSTGVSGSGSGATFNGVEIVDLDLNEMEDKVYQAPEYKSVWQQAAELYTSTCATVVVGFTSVLSGVLDVIEDIGDGVLWVAATVGSAVGADTTGIKEFIARDLVSEANEAFYEHTSLGQAINAASFMEYDSDAAQAIRSGAKTATEFAAATALTVATGGAAGPAVSMLVVGGVGALDGFGKAAEGTYQTYGTDTTGWQELMIAGSGALNAMSWVANGKLGQGFLNIGKAASSIGWDKVLGQIGDDLLNLDYWKAVAKKGLLSKDAIMNYISSGAMMADDFIPLITGQEEWTPELVAQLCFTYVCNLGLNVLQDGLNDYVKGFNYDGSVSRAMAAENQKLDEMTPEERSAYWEQYYKEMYGDDVEVVSNAEMSNAASLEASRANAQYNSDLMPNMDDMTPEQRSQFWADYYKSVYGDDVKVVSSAEISNARADKAAKANAEYNYRLEVDGYRGMYDANYRAELAAKGYTPAQIDDIMSKRNAALDGWTNESVGRGWTSDGFERAQAMDRASQTLDGDDIMTADNFWNEKGTPKGSRPETVRTANSYSDPNLTSQPPFSSYTANGAQVRAQELRQIIAGGEVEAYLTDQQYYDYKVGGVKGARASHNIPYEGRRDATRPYENYVTRLDPSVSFSSTAEAAEYLGTDWKPDVGLYHGTFSISDNTKIAYSSGNELGANPDWIPGGRTLNTGSSTGLGGPDLVLTDYVIDLGNYNRVQ